MVNLKVARRRRRRVPGHRQTLMPTRRVWTILLIAALVTGALLSANSVPASPGGRIVIQGASSGSHLRLSVSGDDLVVSGAMARGQPLGCAFTHGRNLASCPLDGVGSIEVVMGPADDKVEVLEPLPAPLTTRLGAGSDKFVGNAEPDTWATTAFTAGPGTTSSTAGPDATTATGGRAGGNHTAARKDRGTEPGRRVEGPVRRPTGRASWR
jgi:hypothetical protein